MFSNLDEKSIHSLNYEYRRQGRSNSLDPHVKFPLLKNYTEKTVKNQFFILRNIFKYLSTKKT